MFLSKYAVARHIYIPIIKRAVVDFAVGADWTPAGGDVKISIDGGAAANVTNLPTAIVMGNGAMWDFSLTSGEITGKQMTVTVVDAATKAVEDQSFIIETYGNASAQHVMDFGTAIATPLTAAQIATGVWQDTTAADFTTALSVGKSVMNGVSLGTGLTIAAVSGAAGSVTGAVGSVTGNVGGNVVGTVASVVGAVGSVTGMTASDVGAIKTQTDKLTFTVPNVLDANALRINGDATAAAELAKAADTIIRGTCSGGTTTTAIVSVLINPASLTDAGQIIGRTIIFNGATGTANVQGQASNITGSTTGSTPTITFTAMTTAPANGDTFIIS